MDRGINYKRIFSNTVSMYIRMIILTIISLYTVRVVLNALGTSDYGLYSVVGGIVGFFGFVSGSLINSAQRYFSFYLAKRDWRNVSRVFSINMVIYSVLIVAIVLICETIGLWLLFNKMNIEATRMTAAIWVYQLSVVNFAVGLIASPFQAILVSDENLKVYAYISIVEGLLKLVIVYFLSISDVDKLIVYAWLLLITRILITGFYMIYSFVHYRELRFRFVRDKRSYLEVFSYTGWNFIGAIASVCKSQGVNVIINMFFGTAINAARGVASQINSTLIQFSQNFMKAIEPQLVKTYANREEDRFTLMMFFSSKVSFYLMFIVGLPLVRDMQYVLQIWLKEVPDYTSIFSILIIIDTVIGCITDPILTAIQATGRIKRYQIIVGGICLLNLPISYVALRIFQASIVPYIVSIVISVVILVARIYFAHKQISIMISDYVKRVIVPIAFVLTISSLLSFGFIKPADNILTLIKNVFLSLLISVPAVFVFGLSKEEKQILVSVIPWRRNKDDV